MTGEKQLPTKNPNIFPPPPKNTYNDNDIVLIISRVPDIIQRFFILGMKLWIPLFKLYMSPPSSMFVAGKIWQKPLAFVF